MARAAGGPSVTAMTNRNSSNPAGHLPVPAALFVASTLAGLALTYVYDVGATPAGDASDVWTRGSALAPPMFLPLAAVIGVLLARRADGLGAVGTVLAGLVGVMVTLGGTLNAPADLDAARAAGSPEWLTVAMLCLYVPCALGLIVTAVGAMRARRAGGAVSVARA